MIRSTIRHIALAALILCLASSIAIGAVVVDTAAKPPATVCLACHGSQTGPGGIPVKPWQGSVHAAGGIGCQDCHGGDPKDAVNAMSPARGFLGVPAEQGIPAFCGRCHVGILEDYLKSAHGRALGKGGPTCVTCHGSHEVQKVTLEIINEKRCSACHTYERAARIKAAMQEVERNLVRIDGEITRLKQEGVDTDAWGKQLFAVRNRYHRLFHNVDVALVRKESAAIRGELDKLDDFLSRTDEERYRRKIAGAFAVGGFLVAALLAHLLAKSYD